MKLKKCLKLLFLGWTFSAYGILLFLGLTIRLRPPKNTEEKLSQNDERSIRLLTSLYLHPPSQMPYNLSTDPSYIAMKNGYTWSYLDYFLKLLFKNQRNGFFVEAGALDGEFLSNTLRLEKELNWTGLLIEPDFSSYQELLRKNRKSWTSNSCIANTNYSKRTVLLSINPPSGEYNKWVYKGASSELGVTLPSMYNYFTKKAKIKPINVQCFPLYTYLLALNVTNVDFVSLDLQGSELDVLETLPFDKVRIKVFIVEGASEPFFNEKMETFFTKNGYQLIGCDSEPNYVFIFKEAFPQFSFPLVLQCNIVYKIKE